MNYLLAKELGVRGRYFKVLSHETEVTYQHPESLLTVTEYDNDHKLDDDEWFYVDKFLSRAFCPSFLQRDFVPTDFTQISSNAQYKKLEYLLSIQDVDYYYFQRIASGQFIRKKYISITPASVKIEESPIIVVNEIPDAVYNVKDDELYFRNLSVIAPIFRGIDILYKEATREETENFLQNNFITLADGYDAKSVKKSNRKRIAMAMATLNSYTEEEKSSTWRYINDYCENKLTFDDNNNSYSISTEEELKYLLYGIEERFYTTPRSGVKRLANSISPMSS